VKKNHLIIYSNSKNDELGMGDYLRLISFIPNLMFNKVTWIADKKTLDIIRLSEHINNFVDIKNIILKDFIKDHHQVIDLVNNKKNNRNVFYLKNLINKKKNIKENTFDILGILSKFFKIKKLRLYSNNQNIVSTKNSIFINWIVPNEWKIKTMQLSEWKKLKEIICKQTKYKKIIWQNKNDTLQSYFKKINSSEIVLSIVGLGCHIAIMYNKPLILLTGPTYFKEAEIYPKLKILETDKLCKIHSHKLNIKSKQCDCMKYINYDKIIEILRNNS
jgi:hypothetical protein